MREVGYYVDWALAMLGIASIVLYLGGLFLIWAEKKLERLGRRLKRESRR